MLKDGIDNENTVSDRVLVDKLLKPEDITQFGVALYSIGSLAFLILLFFSPAKGINFDLIIKYS